MSRVIYNKDNLIILTPITSRCILAPCAVNYPRLVSEMEPILGDREVNININRAKLQHKFKYNYSKYYEFVLLLDSDVVITQEIVDALKNNWKEGFTPCVRTKLGNTSHVIAACAYMKSTDYVKINYLEKMHECQCLKVPNPFYVEGISTYELKKK